VDEKIQALLSALRERDWCPMPKVNFGDTRLGRSVAIKILKANFDPRFEREARTIASLNHPHILHESPGHVIAAGRYTL
jgi:serine/threonine protein kinase